MVRGSRNGRRGSFSLRLPVAQADQQPIGSGCEEAAGGGEEEEEGEEGEGDGRSLMSDHSRMASRSVRRRRARSKTAPKGTTPASFPVD